MPPKKRRGVSRKKKEDTGENQSSFDAEENPPPSPSFVESNVEKEEKDVVSVRRSSRRKQNTPSEDLLQIESSSSPSSTRRSRRSQKLLNESFEISSEKSETEESLEIDKKINKTIDVEGTNEKTGNPVEKESLEKTKSMDNDDKTQVVVSSNPSLKAEKLESSEMKTLEKTGKLIEKESLQRTKSMDNDEKTQIVDSSNTSLKTKSIESSEMRTTKKIMECRVKLVSLQDTLKKTKLEEPTSSNAGKMDIEESKLELKLAKEYVDLKDEKCSSSIDNVSGNEVKNSVIDNSLKIEIVKTKTDEICEIHNKNENVKKNASTKSTCKISCSSIPILPNDNQEDAADIDTVSTEEIKEVPSTLLSGKHLSENALVSEVKENLETGNENILLITSGIKSQNESSSNIKSCEMNNTLIVETTSSSYDKTSEEVCDKIESSALCSSSPAKNSTLSLTEDSIKKDELLKNKNSDSSNVLLTDITKDEVPQKDNSKNPIAKILERKNLCSESDSQIAAPEKENENKMDTEDKIIEKEPRKSSNLENNVTVKMERSFELDKVSKTISTPKVKSESNLIDDETNKLDLQSKCSKISQNEVTSFETKTIKNGEEGNVNNEISKNTIVEIKPDRESTIEIKSIKNQTELDRYENSAATSEIETDETAKPATTLETESTSETEASEIAKSAATSEKDVNKIEKLFSTSETEADQITKPAITSKIEVNKNEEDTEISETKADKVTKPSATMITKVDNAKPIATLITRVDKAEPAAVSLINTENAESAVTSKAEATSTIKKDKNAGSAAITNAEIDKNACATSKTEADQIVKSATPKIEVDNSADPTSNSRTDVDKNSRPSALLNTDAKIAKPVTSSETKVDKKAKPIATSITDADKHACPAATSETGVNIENSVSVSKVEIDIEISAGNSNKVDKNMKLATSEAEVNKNEKLATTSKTEPDNEKSVLSSKPQINPNAKCATVFKGEVDISEKSFAATEVEKSKSEKFAAVSETGSNKNEKSAVTSKIEVDASFITKSDKNEKPAITSKSDKSEKSEEHSKSDKSEKSEQLSKAEKSEKSEQASKADKNEQSEQPSKSDKIEKSEQLSKAEKSEKSEQASKADKNEQSEQPSKSDKSEKSEQLSKAEKSEKSEQASKADKNEQSEQPSKAEKREKSEQPSIVEKSEQSSKIEADKKETHVQPSKTETGSDSQKNRIPGRSFIIGTRGIPEQGKKTLFDCVLCFNGKEKYGVAGGILNKHIKTKEHALKVMEVENISLYKKFKDDPGAKSEDIINAVLEYEETQKRQTLVLATAENYLSQRLFLEKKIALLKECDARPDVTSEAAVTTETSSNLSNVATTSAPQETSKGSEHKKQFSKPNTGIISSDTSLKTASRKRTLSTEQVGPVPAKIPAAMSTLSFLSTLKKNETESVKEQEADSTKATGKFSSETLSQQLAEKQKGRNPNKIVLVMDDRDVFLCGEKLGDFVRVIRKRELDFVRAVDLVKSDFWFGKGTLFLFFGGVFSSIKVRKHSTCAQYRCEIPVRVYHIEKDIPTNIIIDEALQLHKVILDSTTNDQALFCDLVPVNVDSYNLLKLDKRLCYSTHPIDFHKKVPSRFMDQYTSAVNEFNKFVEKHTEKLGFKFESLIEGTFGKIVTDAKLLFGDLTTDGVTLNETDYKRRCSSILNKVETIRNQLLKSLSVNDPKMGNKIKENIKKNNMQFDKVAIIANSYYKETLTQFASEKVVIYADEDLKFEGIESFILEKKKNLPEKTFWLTLIGSFCISEIKYHDVCQTKLSCKEPLIKLVPSAEAQNLSTLSETIRKVKDSTIALLEKVRSLIGPKSMFFIIPPYPPTIVAETSFTHSDLHSLKCPDTQIYVASEDVITQLNSAFTKLSKEIISLVMKEFQSHKLECSSVESYSKSLPGSGHIQVVHLCSDSRSGLFNKWKDCVNGVISEFVDFSIEVPVPVRNTKKFDHLVFIGHQSLLSQLSNRSGAKFSIINVNYPINFEFLQMKLSSLKSVSNKHMLFVITCDLSLIAKEIFDAKCNNLKCPKMMSYFASDSKDVKTIISDKLMNMRSMILKIKDTYPLNATVIIAPLFSRHCVERPTDINETVHRTLHVILKHNCSPCVVESPRKFWEDGISLLQYYLRDEIMSNLYISNDHEPLTNAIEFFLSDESPNIQWIKPVVAPIADKFKYNMKILFDKLCEVLDIRVLNNTAKTKSSVTESAKSSTTKAVTSVEVKKTSDKKSSSPVVMSTSRSTIIGKPTPNLKDRTLVTCSNIKSSDATASSGNQPSYLNTSQNTSNYQAVQNTSTNYQVPTVPFTYNAMSEPYNAYGMNQGFYPNSYPYYYPNQPPPPQQMPPVGLFQQPPPPVSQIPLPFQFPPPQQDASLQQYHSVTTDVSYLSNNNFNSSITPSSYTQSQVTQPSITDMLSSSVSQIVPTTPAVQPVSATKKQKSVSKKVPQLTVVPTVSTVPTVVRSVVKNIVIEKPKELVDFLSEFGSNTWKDRPYEHAFVIGKKELIEPLSSQNLKNVKFIYQNLASIDEGQVSFLIKKMGAIPHRSVCFLAFGLSIIMKTTPMTPGCIKFKCKQSVPGSCLKSQSHLSQQMSIITRIKDIVNLSTKMTSYIPVVVLPIFPSKVFVDDAKSLPYHKISHAINDKNSYVLIGESNEWNDSIATFLQTWNNFMKVHHDKYTYPKAIPKYPYLKNTITIGNKVKDFFEEDNQPLIWENAVKKIIKILMSYTEGSNIEKTITVTKTEETTVSSRASSSTDSSTQTVVKVWNFSDSIPEKFFDFLFKAIDPKSSLDKIDENDEHYYLVKLTKVSAILITRKLDNIIIGDSTLRVSLIQDHDDYPELTSAQEKYISSMFIGAYSRFKSQIIKSIKNKLLNVIDFTNYKTTKCNGNCHGDKPNCNFYHSSNDRRRHPLLCTYRQKMCPNPKSCPDGVSCSYTHNIYEQMFYPTNFQTILCPLHDIKTPLTDGFCKFAHKNSPELFFTGSWEDIVTFGTQNSLRFLLGAMRAIHKLTLRTDVKILFITQSEEFLETAFKIVDYIAFPQYSLRCLNLETIRHDTNEYDVYFGKPSTVNNYSGKILSISDYGVLIVDNIKGIMEHPQDAEYLLKICQRLKISAGLRSPINKVFVSSSYDQGVTGVVSRFLGIPLQEVKESDIYPETKLVTESESKNTLNEGSKDIVVISSRSRSHSRSRTLRSLRSRSRSRRTRSRSRSLKKRSRSRSLKRRSRSRSLKRRSRSRSLKRRSRSRSLRRRSRSRSLRRRSRSRSRRNRSVSRSRRSLSRSRKRRSRSHSVTKSRRRSPLRSRHSRSKSKTRKISSLKSRKSPSKSYRKRPDSPKSGQTRKRPASPENRPQISKVLKLDELLSKQSQISDKSKLDQLLAKQSQISKISQNVFSPHEIFQSSSKMSLENEKNVPSVKTLGEEMFRKFTAKKESLTNSVEEEFKAFKAFPELHPNYETHYEEFLSDYYKTYGMNTKEDHKEGLWIMFWGQKVKRLKEAELDKKIKELEKQFLNPQPKNVEKTKGFALQKATFASPDTFSVENTLKLLEELSSELGMLGPAIIAIINSAREYGPTTSKGLSVIIDEENLVLIKMIIEKMNSLQKTCPSSQLPKLIKGAEWTQKLIEYAKNPPKEQGLNLMAIAKASLGKDSGFTLNLIKTALAYEGLPSMSKEEINQLFLKVCSMHFEMAMQDK